MWRAALGNLRRPITLDAADGKGVSPDDAQRWLLGVTQGDALAGAAGEAIQRGIVTAALGSATLDSVAATVTAKPPNEEKTCNRVWWVA